MDDGAKKAGGVLAAVIAAVGLFAVRGLDDCARVGARTASHADDVARVGRYGDDLAGAGRYGDDLAGARYGDDLAGARYGDDLAGLGDEARLRGGGSPGNRTGASFGGAHFADEALSDAHHLGDDALLGDDAIETIADTVIDVGPDAAEIAFGGDDDDPELWPARGPSLALPARVRVLALGEIEGADASLGSLFELESALASETESAVDVVIARAEQGRVIASAGDPARTVEALLLRAAQLGRRAVLIACGDERCARRAIRAARVAAVDGPIGLSGRLVAARDAYAPAATLYRLHAGERVQLATSAPQSR